MQVFFQSLVCVLVSVCVSGAMALAVAEDPALLGGTVSNGVILFDLERASEAVREEPSQSHSHTHRHLTEDGPDSPLYRGFGTHFVYVYVGTPRQRVSVIVDTGSHHTAFPCTGCSQCGDHTDLYFNPKDSSTAIIPKCNGKNCIFSQSYTEGSMWTAYRVKDRFFIGGETTVMAPDAESHDVEFTFGCQTKETGLFRTQMENGIMGLSADAKTLPNTLYAANKTSTNCFALCFLPTGGVMSLGGSHPHLKQGKMGYAQMTKKSGYFTVKVLAMFLRKADEKDMTELKVPMAKLNSGKGVIVDSGTTDTYLPSAISSAFQSLFKKLCGTSYTKASFIISAENVKKLPTVVFHLQKWDPSGKSTEYVQVEFPPIRYLEPSRKKEGKEMFVFRLYLTERSGGVLGANFMTGQNVEFDQKQQRIGFAPSHCKNAAGEPLYKGITKPVKLKKHRLRKLDDIASVESRNSGLFGAGMGETSVRRRLSSEPDAANKPILRPIGPCNAQCNNRPNTASPTTGVVSVSGFMPAEDSVKSYIDGKDEKLPVAKGKIACEISCDVATNQQVRVIPTSDGSIKNCPVLPWGMCGQDCKQSLAKGNGTVATPANPDCVSAQHAPRNCWRELCPFRPAVECAHRLKLTLPLFKVKKWNNLWKEDIINAVAKTLKVDPGKVDIPDPIQKQEFSVYVVVHVRTDKVRSGSGLECPKIDTLSSTAQTTISLRDSFVKELHLLQSTVCGNWDWVREENTLFAPEGMRDDAARSSRLELNIRPSILRRQEREAGNVHHPKVRTSQKLKTNGDSFFVRWRNLVIHRDNFVHALVYTVLLVLTAVSFICFYRLRQQEHQEKLESPRSNINGFKYYTPQPKSRKGGDNLDESD